MKAQGGGGGNGGRATLGAMLRFISILLLAAPAGAQIIPDATIRRMLDAISADRVWSHTAAIAGFSRYPNSQGFFDAAGYVAAQAKALGLENVRVERFERREPMWDPVEGELDITVPEPRRIATLADTAVLVAQMSAEGDATAPLVDVGDGTHASDYQGKNVRGAILLATGEPDAVWRAMGKRGAAGVISANEARFFGRATPRQAVAWGHAAEGSMAMMISPEQAEDLRGALARGAVTVRMRIRVKRSEPGAIGMLMGELPGEVSGEDIVVAAHLDHQKPAANDNASGSAALLEVLRVARSLGKPRRTIRFWWSTEIAAEREYFRAHPEEAKRIRMAVVLDQAGGDLRAENHFIVVGGPDWLPCWTDDLIENLAEHMKERYAPPEHAPSADFVAPGGSREPMRPVYWDYAPLSDHISFEDRAVGIPAIALAVPSLEVIHTNLDTMDRIDPTWLKRSTLMTLAPAWFAANAGPREAQAVLEYTFRRALARLARATDPGSQLEIELARLDSIARLDPSVSPAAYKKRLAAAREAAFGK